jgi:5-methyltetrahydropteroyltriglutamate--homocysteine methyltransferase
MARLPADRLEPPVPAVPPPFPAATILGYPRIGPHRELKRALESYWAGETDQAALLRTGADLRAASWRRLAGLGLDHVPVGTFSYYDHVLDTALLVGAVPDRFRAPSTLDTYFAMARGTAATPPLRMTKWFDTNYHYLVPEIGPDTAFALAPEPLRAELAEAAALGLRARPVVLGPVTFLLLAEPAPGSPPGFTPLDRLPDLLPVYAELLADLPTDWVQLDEPALVADRTGAELSAVRTAYDALGDRSDRPGLFVATYFGDPGPALPVLAGTPVEAIGLDLVRGPAPAVDLPAKTVVAGVVSGRDVWRTDPAAALGRLDGIRAARVTVSTSCSLLHVPYDLDAEPDLDPALRDRLAFADQKVAEVLALAAADRPHATVQPRPSTSVTPRDGHRSPYQVRRAAQAGRLRLPVLPTTTIGSFPQTPDLRAARAAHAAGRLDTGAYEDRLRAEIRHVIAAQERLGLDVLVHGEPERNDMVQYFAEHLDGIAVTRNGWVQSYGSRCTRPPVIHGDVSRPEPITLRWTRYAQSLTDRPVKGMLTGPVTIAAWSFVRDDLPLREVVGQLADAIRAEVADLVAAGTAIIQVDEPALREVLPLRRARQADYLAWATAAYRWATSSADDRTQVHTHLCYSDAAEILAAIDALDADVTTIESARSGGRILAEPGLRAYPRALGPGVYDIHSPRVPSTAEITAAATAALGALPPERVWVNPDCGLKTRGYAEVDAALARMVAVTRELRAELTEAVTASASGPTGQPA